MHFPDATGGLRRRFLRYARSSTMGLTSIIVGARQVPGRCGREYTHLRGESDEIQDRHEGRTAYEHIGTSDEAMVSLHSPRFRLSPFTRPPNSRSCHPVEFVERCRLSPKERTGENPSIGQGQPEDVFTLPPPTDTPPPHAHGRFGTTFI